MANERDNTTPPCMRYMGKVIDDLVGTTVDLTCLADYDLDMIDAVEAFAAHEAYKTHYLKGDGTYQNEDDALLNAEAMGRSIANVCAASRRKHAADEPLFVLLYGVANLAYEHGVRDGYDGRLSSDCARRITKDLDRSDEKHEAMREFLDDVRE